MTLKTENLSKQKKIGNRGKFAEGKVKDYLKARSDSVASFDFERILDARSAGGRFPSRPGDFGFYSPLYHGLIEVKEVEHDFRLPHKNFSTEQVSKLRKRKMAGGVIIILVYHKTTKLWRLVEFEYLEGRNGGSWDLSEYPTSKSHKELLDPIFNQL